MKHFLTTIFLFPILFSFYGFVLLPLFLPTPEFSFMSIFSFMLESLGQLVIGYLVCIPVSIICTSLFFKRVGNPWAVVTFGAIIGLLYILSSDLVMEILALLLPLLTIVHYHSRDLLQYWKDKKASARN